ncbi:hypothetical protein [Streptomyces chattanoogensis]|uniref:hypothetical protein n=1 Tax=Streptomyces chattanoogensis TaxID=66876 RepID=UPI0036C3E8F6
MSGRDDLDFRAGRLRDLLNSHTNNAAHLAEAPERVHEAWAKVVELSDSASDALDAWYMIRHEGEQAERARLAEHRAHLAGEGPKPKGAYKPMDVDARRADALLACQARADLAFGARGQYDQVLKDPKVLEETRAALVAKFDGLQDKTREAVAKAEAAFHTWIRVMNDLAQVTLDLDLGRDQDGMAPPTDSDHRRWFDQAHEAWANLNRLLGSNHPVATGRWAAMSREELEAKPPVWARELLSLNLPWSSDRKRLRRVELLERAEGRVVTTLEVPADMSPAEAKDLLPSTR